MNRLSHGLRDLFIGIKAQGITFTIVLFSITVGAASSATLTGVIRGIMAKEASMIDSLGVDALVLSQTESRSNDAEPLSRHHVDGMRELLTDLRLTTSSSHQVSTAGITQTMTVFRVDPHLMQVRRWILTDGRAIDSVDMARAARVAVVSEALGAEWGWQTDSVILLDDLPFRVIGMVRTRDVAESAGEEHGIASGTRRRYGARIHTCDMGRQQCASASSC